MENKITINVPSGKIAQQTTNENGNITIKFVDPEPIRSKSWAEFCRNHPNTEYEYFINQHGGIDFRTSGPRNTINNLTTKEDAEGILALIQLTRLHDEWVGDWNVVRTEKINEGWYAIKKVVNRHVLYFE